MNAPARRGAVLLMGPTCAGKSELAVRLTQSFPLEIVSTDSALVYRGMDIGTAKPDLALRRAVPHHLIDILEPEAAYSAGDFVSDSAALLDDIRARGHHPLFVGGTMLYFNSLSDGIAALPDRDLEVRAALDARALAEGWPALHAELAAVDPEAASRIHPNDPQRIQRALEVFELTGQPISRLQRARVSPLAGFEVLEIVIAPADRQILHRRIERRFDAMLAAGFLDEMARLRARTGLHAEHPSMRAVGYRQMWRHLDGAVALDEARSQAIAATRQLAKRQLTWLRARGRAVWFDSMHPDAPNRVSDALSWGGISQWS
jgi:tRNA dimethylallyltransferase